MVKKVAKIYKAAMRQLLKFSIGSLANSPKKKAKAAPARPAVGPAPNLLKNLPRTKSLSKMELEDLFDML